ncbi:uncharacterized protein L3040_001578 [Drepanopeziza brunnea f. sp. 'multigermtubi']|uniref:uncharacterized protein n=1 Tax=Drepanopeziza brunnea f. sp. 'multigermtubi' TaxID=698441 RepID=UPI0023844489|nr:hypothetical protein L3040_001578 [Drepanopeziza brunnea f. sp. 'multigermtubi']
MPSVDDSRPGPEHRKFSINSKDLSLSKSPEDGTLTPNDSTEDPDPRLVALSQLLPDGSIYRTPESIQDEVTSRSSHVLRVYSQLQGLMGAFQNISEGWMKKRVAQRKDLMKSAWPDIPQSHRPDHELLISRNPSMRSMCWDWVICLRDPPEYGKLISTAEDSYALARVISRIDFYTWEGLQVLEIQEKILEFLLDCCGRILKDHRVAELASEWTTLDDLNREAPYCPPKPTTSDLGKLHSLMAAELSRIAETVRDCCAANPAFSTTSKEWPDRVASFIAYDAYCPAIAGRIIWDLLLELELLKVMNPEVTETILIKYCDESPSLRRWMDSLLCFRSILVRYHTTFVEEIVMALHTEASFRRYFDNNRKITRNSVSAIWQTDKLFVLLKDMSKKFNDGYFSRTRHIILEIERLLQNNFGEKKRLSPRMLRAIGIAGLFGSLIEEFDAIHPSVGTKAILSDHEDTEGRLEEIIKWRLFPSITYKEHALKYLPGCFGDPDGSSFTFSYVERNLATFWKRYDQAYEELAGRSIHTYEPPVFQCQMNPRSITPVAEHEPRVDDELLQATLNQNTPVPGGNDNNTNPDMSGSSIRGERWSEQDDDEPLPSTNSGQANQSEKEGSKSDDPHDTDFLGTGHTPAFEFTERSRKIFRKIFSPYSNPPSRIRWNDFLTAMADAGFSVVKQCGSAWLFMPLNLSPEKWIILHEPAALQQDKNSSDLSIDFNAAQLYARRLTFAYDWDQTMFQSSETTSESSKKKNKRKPALKDDKEMANERPEEKCNGTGRNLKDNTELDGKIPAEQHGKAFLEKGVKVETKELKSEAEDEEERMI